MGIIVENPGIQTTVQDEGRFGYQQFRSITSRSHGYPVLLYCQYSGRKQESESALEITFIGTGAEV